MKLYRKVLQCSLVKDCQSTSFAYSICIFFRSAKANPLQKITLVPNLHDFKSCGSPTVLFGTTFAISISDLCVTQVSKPDFSSDYCLSNSQRETVSNACLTIDPLKPISSVKHYEPNRSDKRKAASLRAFIEPKALRFSFQLLYKLKCSHVLW